MALFSFGKKKVKDLGEISYPSWMVSPTPSGFSVTPRTAMQLTAVYGCVRILGETIAELPLHLYRYTADGGKEKAVGHPLYRVLHDEPNSEQTSFIFRENMMTHLLLWGNAYAQIIRNGRGEVVHLYPLRPDRMTVSRGRDGRLWYQYQRSTDDVDARKNETVVLRNDEVFHIPGLGFDGLIGYSPLTMARNALGAAMASDHFADKFFSNAALPSGVLEYPSALKDPKKFRETWEGTFAGAMNAGKTPVLEDGMKYHQISVSPQDAQFLETRKFNINEIARIFRVPPHMLADLEKSSFSNIEQQSIEFVKYTISPWAARIEQQMKKSLLLEHEKSDYFVSFNVSGLMRGDYASRMNGYAIARQNGWMNANDIRELEDLNRIPAEDGGDLYLVNGNMLPLKMAGAYANNGGKEGGTK